MLVWQLILRPFSFVPVTSKRLRSNLLFARKFGKCECECNANGQCMLKCIKDNLCQIRIPDNCNDCNTSCGLSGSTMYKAIYSIRFENTAKLLRAKWWNGPCAIVHTISLAQTELLANPRRRKRRCRTSEISLGPGRSNECIFSFNWCNLHCESDAKFSPIYHYIYILVDQG